MAVGLTKSIDIPQRSPRRIGVVQSDQRDKTRKVAIHYTVKHRKYGKHVRRRTVLHVHDEENRSKVGDRVEIAECRPISKTKSWVLIRILGATTPEADRPADAAAEAADPLETGGPPEGRANA